MSAPQMPQRPPPRCFSRARRAPAGVTLDGPIAELLAIEHAGTWPAGLPAYRRGLDALAEALGRQDPIVRWSVYCWLEAELGGLLHHRSALLRQVRREALEDVVLDGELIADKLTQAAERLCPARQPNILSFMRAMVIWRANDIVRWRHRRHDERLQFQAAPVDTRIPSSWSRAIHATTLGQLLAGFDFTRAEAKVIDLLADGESVAEAARRTGRSRQQIYRLLERMRAWAVRQPLFEQPEAAR